MRKNMRWTIYVICRVTIKGNEPIRYMESSTRLCWQAAGLELWLVISLNDRDKNTTYLPIVVAKAEISKT